MLVTTGHLNGGNVCQGGALFTLADLAIAALMNCHGQLTFGISNSIMYVSSAKEGDLLRAEAVSVSDHHKIPSVEVRVTNQEGRLICHVTGMGYRKNIPVPTEETEKTAPPNENLPSDDLWQRIVNMIHKDDLWRKPDLSLDRLCQKLGSNKDYVSRCFRQNANTTFLDYVNNLRISYVTDELRRNPLQSPRDLFSNAGFRSKTTAYRNFCKYNGQSPSDFIASLNENK